MKKSSGDYGVEPIFIATVSLKRELLKKFEDELDFFPSANFVIVHSLTINPSQNSIAVLKGQWI